MDEAAQYETTSRGPLVALLSANAISLIGNQLTFIAVPWFVLQSTGSAVQTGIVAAVTALPAIVAAAFGGTLVDRLGFKRTSIVADLASSVTVAMIPTLHLTIGLEFWQLLALAFLGSLLDTPGSTARTSLLPDLAQLAGIRLERASAVEQMVWRGSGLLGPPLAGLLIVWLGTSNVLFLDGLSFAISAAIIAKGVPSSSRHAKPAQTATSYFAEMGEGLRFLFGDRLLLAIVASFTFRNAIGEPVFAVALPVYAREVFGSAIHLGTMLGAYAAGGLIATMAFGAAGHRLPRRATYIGCLVLVGTSLTALAGLPGLLVIAGCLAFAGVAGMPVNIIALTVSQERIPAEMRGRVFGLARGLALSTLPIGMLLVGFLLEVVGIRATLIAVAGGYLLLALGLFTSRTFRAIDSERPV